MNALSPEFVIAAAEVSDAEGIQLVGYEVPLATYPLQEASITPDICHSWAYGTNSEEAAAKLQRIRDNIASADKSADSSTMIHVARYYGRAVGYITSKKSTDAEDNAGMYPATGSDNRVRHAIDSLFVLPVFQGSGLGRQLMAHGLDWLGPEEDVYVRVATYNNARRLYRRIGFQEIGVDHEWEADFGYHMPEVIGRLPREQVPTAIAMLAGTEPLPEGTPAGDFSTTENCLRRQGPPEPQLPIGPPTIPGAPATPATNPASGNRPTID